VGFAKVRRNSTDAFRCVPYSFYTQMTERSGVTGQPSDLSQVPMGISERLVDAAPLRISGHVDPKKALGFVVDSSSLARM